MTGIPEKIESIALDKLEIVDAMCEETICFSAVVVVNGSPMLTARNDGRGGCNLYRPVNGMSGADSHALVQMLEAHAASMSTMENPEEWIEHLDLHLAGLMDEVEQGGKCVGEIPRALLLVVKFVVKQHLQPEEELIVGAPVDGFVPLFVACPDSRSAYFKGLVEGAVMSRRIKDFKGGE